MFKVRYSVDGSCDSLRDQFRHIVQTCANVKLLKTIQNEPFNLREGRYEFFLNVYCTFIGVNRVHAKFVPVVPGARRATIVGFCRDDATNRTIHVFSTRIIHAILNEMTGKATVKVEDCTRPFYNGADGDDRYDDYDDNDKDGDNVETVVVRKMTKYSSPARRRAALEADSDRAHSNGAFKLTHAMFNVLCKLIVCADLAAYEYNNFIKGGKEKRTKYLFSILTKRPNSDINKKIYQLSTSNNCEISMSLRGGGDRDHRGRDNGDRDEDDDDHFTDSSCSEDESGDGGNAGGSGDHKKCGGGASGNLETSRV